MFRINVCGWGITAQVRQTERCTFGKIVKRTIEKNFSGDIAIVTFSDSTLISNLQLGSSILYKPLALVEIGGENEKDCRKFAKQLDQAMRKSENKKMRCLTFITYRLAIIPHK